MKCDKICELKLTSEEWLWVNSFLGLLSVHLLSTLSSSNQHLTLPSMLIMLNRRSHPTVLQPYIWAFLRLKPFIGHGLVELIVQNISDFLLPFMLHVRRSTSTMQKLQSPLCTSCQWV